MELSYFQKGFNYAQDGPGNRLVYHLQGCNLHCPWCSNPEGMGKESCGMQREPVSRIVEFVLSSRSMFFSGGGLTLSGGEFSLQLDAAAELLQRLSKEGIHTAAETNATSGRLPELFSCLNLLIVDVKHYDSAIHRQITGLGNARVFQNLGAAASAGQNVLIRIPLIKGFNASETDLEGFLKALAPYRRFPIELLTYHEYGREKWKACGLEYAWTDGYPDRKTVQLFRGRFLSAGFTLVST